MWEFKFYTIIMYGFLLFYLVRVVPFALINGYTFLIKLPFIFESLNGLVSFKEDTNCIDPFMIEMEYVPFMIRDIFTIFNREDLMCAEGGNTPYANHDTNTSSLNSGVCYSAGTNSSYEGNSNGDSSSRQGNGTNANSNTTNQGSVRPGQGIESVQDPRFVNIGAGRRILHPAYSNERDNIQGLIPTVVEIINPDGTRTYGSRPAMEYRSRIVQVPPIGQQNLASQNIPSDISTIIQQGPYGDREVNPPRIRDQSGYSRGEGARQLRFHT
jgi:hypothetical protein